MSFPELAWALPLLRCPRCRGALRPLGETSHLADGILACDGPSCGERYPVIAGVPRLVTGTERQRVLAKHADWFAVDRPRGELRDAWHAGTHGRSADATVSGFDFEWEHFSAAGTSELATVFEEYFDLIPGDRFASEQVVLDAGCGAGRWALEVARRGARVLAVDLGESIEIARRNTLLTGRVACVQADIRDLPLAPASVDWAYSLGVLHHLDDPSRALRHIVDPVVGQGPVLLYVYYALDHRGRLYRALFQVVGRVRRVTSALPRPLTLAFAALTAVAVYWPLARSARLAERLGRGGLAAGLPLSYYRDRSLTVMLNDSLDRFGTRIEKRFTRAEVIGLFRSCGITDVKISARPPFWHAVGARTR